MQISRKMATPHTMIMWKKLDRKENVTDEEN